MDIVRKWWKCCERKLDDLMGIIQGNPNMINEPQIEIGFKDEPKITEETKSLRFASSNEENHSYEAECAQILNVDTECPQCVQYLMERVRNEPVKPKAISSSPSQQTRISTNFRTAIAQLDREFINEFGITVHSTSIEHGYISNLLKQIIKNIEPATPVENCERPDVANKSSSRRTATVNLAYCCYKVVEDVAKIVGMKVTLRDRCWDVIWYSRPVTEDVCARFSKTQRANYFPESQRVVWKNNLALCLTKMSKVFPREYNFFPKSWCLPREWHLLEKHSRKYPREWYIVKPNNWGCGYGIYLTNEVSKLSNCGKMTAQIYIQKPFLIDDLKFDLRIYVLVTSCKPLRIFVYNEALARFATDKYHDPDHQNKTNRYMHLTNYAVNKNSPQYVVDENKGTLRRWTTVSEWLTEHEIDPKAISASMDDVIIKTLIAMTPTLKYHYFRSFPAQADSNSCFQIFGFDIMFGSDLKVYVLEVNGSPQFHADVTLDIEMTRNLIKDTFNILNLAEIPQDPAPLIHANKLRSMRSTTQSRIEWEDSHLGNFRKIYPNDRNKFYNKFMHAADHFIRPL